MPVYLIFISIFFLLPLVLFWLFYGQILARYKKTFLLATILTFFFGVPWDMLSVVSGLWRYDSTPTLKLWLGVLPLEEYLFTLIFPIFVVTFTIIVRDYLKRYVR